MGMPHRGRLAMMIVNQNYPMKNLFYKIKGGNDIPAEIPFGTDDIPTHIGVSNTRKYFSGGNVDSHNPLTVSMVHNPSHLES